MALYVGDTVALRVDVSDPFTDELLSEYTVHADLYYSAGTNPRTTPAIRESPDVAGVPFAWDTTHEAYLGYVDTTGYPPGTIYVRLRVDGPVYKNVEYSSFKIVV